MILVYDERQRPQFLADVRRKHDGEPVLAKNPKYFRGPEDLEHGDIRCIYLCDRHLILELLYAARGIPILHGRSVVWDETLVPIPASDAAPLEAHPTGYTLSHEGYGWFHVIDPNGSIVTEKAMRRGDAEALRATIGINDEQPDAVDRDAQDPAAR